jgi:hypothetical protein
MVRRRRTQNGRRMKYELGRLPEYSDEALLSELRRVARLVAGGKLTIAEYSRHSKVGVTTLRRRFGSWPNALEAAGLAHLYNSIPTATKSRTLARTLPSDDLLAEIRRVAQVVGRDRLTAEDLRQHAIIGVDAIRRRFGTLKAALRAAGLLETAHGRRYTDEACLENLLQVWTHYGRPPQYQEMKLPPSTVGPKAYIGRWGTWNRALHAFVERVNHEPEVQPEAPDIQVASPLQVDKPREEDVHRIRLSLRYSVLVRDQFKCRLCGSSPAVDPRCRLHVDHIQPWSKGGKTIAENLRTLCEPCNLGKGNTLAEAQDA